MTTSTLERTHLADLPPDDQFRLPGREGWCRVLSTTTETIYARDPRAGEISLDLADFGDAERADHTGMHQTSILRWHGGGWTHHQTCFIPQDWTQTNLRAAACPSPSSSKSRNSCPTTGGSACGLAHHMLVKEA
ncbi:hypothetical protein [Isoptericola dokdonensis]|uniref:Uncharacterized protein n=1 Tax=Isoptericola dokdonensis DS-3 TaxID=1300344 RepID=A0A168EAR2_9MICO|nr:hypothetical protein [Isoptericola dokdonensis]ANC29813.1 hypothetical protein I598_0222 [Isoptericola dokdonensis DS-3]